MHTIRSGPKRLFHQLYVLAQEELRELTLRKRSFLALVLYMCAISILVLGLAYIENRISPTLGIFRVGSSELSSLLAKAQRFGLGDEAQLFAQVARFPSPVVILQIFSLLWLPTLVALVSCDMVTIDIYRGTLRYIVLRTSRTVYYFSKLVAHFLLYFIIQCLTIIALVILCALRVPDFHWSEYLNPSIRYLLVFLPFLWFVVAMTEFVSCWSSKPMNAIVRLHLMWALFFILLYFCPWASPVWKPNSLGLIAPFESLALKSILGMTAWSLVFTFGGLFLFRRRTV